MNRKFVGVFYILLAQFFCGSLKAQVPYYGGEKATPLKDVSKYWVPSYRHQLRYPESSALRHRREIGSVSPIGGELRRPSENRFKRVEGCVVLKYLISKEGRAKNIEVVAEYPNGIYVDITVDTIRRYKWQATEENVNRTPLYSNARFIFHNASQHPFHEDAICDWPELPKPVALKNCQDSKKSRLLKTCE